MGPVRVSMQHQFDPLPCEQLRQCKRVGKAFPPDDRSWYRGMVYE